MSVRDCIDKLAAVPGVKSSVIASAKKIEKKAEELRKVYEAQGIPDAATRADAEAVRFFTEETNIRQRALVVDQDVQSSVLKAITTDERGQTSALSRHLVKTDDAIGGNFGMATKELGDFFERIASKYPGGFDAYLKSNKLFAKDFVRGLAGDTKVAGDIAEFAVKAQEAKQYLIQRLKASGVRVTDIDPYAIDRDPSIIIAMSKDEYVNAMLPHIDLQKTLINDLPVTEEQIIKVLKDEHTELSSQVRQGTLNSDRVYAFKTPEDAMAVLAKFGDGDPVTNYMMSLKNLAKEVALAENLGPNYRQNFKLLRDNTVAKDGLSKNFLTNIDTQFDELIGRSQGIGNRFLGAAGQALRNNLAGAKLIFTGISSLGDLATMQGVARNWGISYTKLIGHTVKSYFSPGTIKTQRQFMSRAAGNLEYRLNSRSVGNRFGDVGNIGTAAKLTGHFADATVRLSGAAHLTARHKESLFDEFHNHLFDRSHLEFDQLDIKTKNTLEFYRIKEETWNEWRKAAFSETREDGSLMEGIDPMLMSPKAATELNYMLVGETRASVPEPDLVTRSIRTGGKASGTIEREVRSLSTSFMSYAITSARISMDRILHHKSNVGVQNKVAYAANALIGSAMLGALIMTLTDLGKGKDPRDYSDPMFWLEALTYNNSFGLQYITRPLTSAIGNIKDNKRFNPHQFVSSITPPSFGALFDAGATAGNLASAIAKGEFEGAAKEAALFLSRNMPVGSPLTELAFDRYVKDSIEKWADPKATSKWRRGQKALKKRTGQEEYWKAGQSPRLPKFTDKPE